MFDPSQVWPGLDVTDLQALYKRPGFLMRRAHQIAVSIFMDETAPTGVTTTQYGLMYILRARPGLDQISLAKLIGLDRSTTGLVLGKLERSGLVVRQPSAHDRRRKELALTPQGETLLVSLAEPVQRAQAKAMEPFTEAERVQFLSLLEKFVTVYNGVVRAPLTPG
jgi:MarR family transcriptional regulator, lower aerobic nicotinate degradation pathway regulator